MASSNQPGDKKVVLRISPSEFEWETNHTEFKGGYGSRKSYFLAQNGILTSDIYLIERISQHRGNGHDVSVGNHTVKSLLFCSPYLLRRMEQMPTSPAIRHCR
uniref:Uncharacterized protein n=1 Tax=Ixodes ricinus TaxID=34613 RepID=A0A0K8R551_IXORI